MQEQNTFTSFTAYKNIPATGQVLTPKDRKLRENCISNDKIQAKVAY
jgi:hypothetical protein